MISVISGTHRVYCCVLVLFISMVIQCMSSYVLTVDFSSPSSPPSPLSPPFRYCLSYYRSCSPIQYPGSRPGH